MLFWIEALDAMERTGARKNVSLEQKTNHLFDWNFWLFDWSRLPRLGRNEHGGARKVLAAAKAQQVSATEGDYTGRRTRGTRVKHQVSEEI